MSGIEKRFWAKVFKSAECWLWLGAQYHAGHGMFRLDGRINRAHRVAWELENGPIADGLVICHRCDVPNCVNPAHLFEGTQADNLADMKAKGRIGRKGAPFIFPKLTKTEAIEFSHRLIAQRTPQTAETLFWQKVDTSGDCWLWKSPSSTVNGYGRLKFKGKLINAHRAAWELANGRRAPAGMDVCHRCDVRRCVRPDHLFLGTRSENMLDASKKGRLPQCFGSGRR